jgi:hypothetical protein
VLFESAGIYGVNRHTRANEPGYGNVGRTGQFLFPPHLQRKTYNYWDPLFIGPRVAKFARTDQMNGLTVYVFHFTVRSLNETAGYAYLADVPERYDAHTDAQGTLWIEPVSGIVVDYKEHGTSYFFEKKTNRRIADLFDWTDRFTPETKDSQWKLAVAARRRMLMLEVALPLGLLVGGLICLGLGLRRTLPLGLSHSGAES